MPDYEWLVLGGTPDDRLDDPPWFAAKVLTEQEGERVAEYLTNRGYTSSVSRLAIRAATADELITELEEMNT